jgi:hypothetical protein
MGMGAVAGERSPKGFGLATGGRVHSADSPLEAKQGLFPVLSAACEKDLAKPPPVAVAQVFDDHDSALGFASMKDREYGTRLLVTTEEFK